MSEPDVFEGSMRIARVEYPALDAHAYRSRLEEFGAQALAKVTARGRRAVEQLNAFVFDTLGFHGNADDYYDPKNSYLNDVIDRRTGIPISLAAVYCEIGRRAGLKTYGVGFPGHFLAKALVPGGEVIVDCFNGRTLTRRDCRELLESFANGEPEVTDDMLEIAAPREILSRMLQNLRRIHVERQDFVRAIRWIDMDLELKPDSLHNYRERGMLYIRREEFGKAIADLEHYLRLSPGAPDQSQIREQVQLLRRLLSHLN